ncbi:MAG: glutathione S-transferase family protein [Cupriavidus sp.]|nr:MAG: glutathione S-transferase family protein [Cupriavidus sp.]
MTKPFIHYAWHLSYFSGKTRSYLLYKDIPFVEKPIDFYTFSVRARKHTNAAVMPIVVTPEGEWLQDTSNIIDRLEQRFPQAPVVPATPVQRMASYLMELWADEWWLVVAMYTRWCHPENYPLFLHDAGKGLLPYFPRFLQNRFGAKAANQMRGHLPSLGLIPGQIELIAEWTRNALDLLEKHFNQYPYLFGNKPSIGDFGLIGPLYAHLGRDPWSKRELIDTRPSVRAWVDRMNKPEARSGEFLPADQIPQTLTPLFQLIFDEFLPLIEGILREVNKALPKCPAGKPLPRGLGIVNFPMGKGSYGRAAIPYILWMVQRILDGYQLMTPKEQASVRAWMTGLGGERLLDLQIPRLRRVGLRVAAA